VKRYLGNAYREPDWPHNYQAEHLEATVAHARELGIPMLIVEIPVHGLLEQLMPPGTPAKFRRFMRDVSQRHGVPFFSVEDLGTRFVPKDFREQSHLNYRGAMKYTNAIAPLVVRALEENGRPRVAGP
jgi:hypothetical protein